MTAEEELKDLALRVDLPELLEVVVWKGAAMTPLERAAKACDEWEQEPPVPGRLLKARLHELIALAIREAEEAQLRILRTALGWRRNETLGDYLRRMQEAVNEQREQAVSAEREACAQLAQRAWESDYGGIRGITNLAPLIRARGQS